MSGTRTLNDVQGYVTPPQARANRTEVVEATTIKLPLVRDQLSYVLTRDDEIDSHPVHLLKLLSKARARASKGQEEEDQGKGNSRERQVQV